jgi:hypothetical protein
MSKKARKNWCLASEKSKSRNDLLCGNASKEAYFLIFFVEEKCLFNINVLVFNFFFQLNPVLIIFFTLSYFHVHCEKQLNVKDCTLKKELF